MFKSHCKHQLLFLNYSHLPRGESSSPLGGDILVDGLDVAPDVLHDDLNIIVIRDGGPDLFGSRLADGLGAGRLGGGGLGSCGGLGSGTHDGDEIELGVGFGVRVVDGTSRLEALMRIERIVPYLYLLPF